MRIALVQQPATTDKAANVRRGLDALTEAAARGADLVCFAELAFERFHPQVPAEPGFESLAEPVPGPITEAFAARARELGVVVVLNLYERDGEDCYDSSPVIAQRLPGDVLYLQLRAIPLGARDAVAEALGALAADGLARAIARGVWEAERAAD